jgi:hypothetical protein
MGRVVNMWSCGPASCGTSYQYNRSLSFAYDWVGNLTQSSDGSTGTINYRRSIAGEVTSITNATYQVDEGHHTYCSNSARYLSRPLSPPGPSVAGHLGASMDRLCYQAHSERRANPADCIKSWSAIRAQGFI